MAAVVAEAKEKEAPAETPVAPKKTIRQPAPWKPQEFVAKKAGGIGNKKTVAVGEPVVPVNQRQEEELKKRGIIK